MKRRNFLKSVVKIIPLVMAAPVIINEFLKNEKKIVCRDSTFYIHKDKIIYGNYTKSRLTVTNDELTHLIITPNTKSSYDGWKVHKDMWLMDEVGHWPQEIKQDKWFKKLL